MCGQTVWPKYVHDVAVPWGFARPWWEVRLRGAVPLGVSQKSAPQELPTRVTHKSVPQECPTRWRVAGERDDWWHCVICLLLVCGGPLQRCADTARNAPRLALLSHNVALPFHLHIDVYTPSPLYTHRHRYTHRHTHTQTHTLTQHTRLDTSHLTPNTQLTF